MILLSVGLFMMLVGSVCFNVALIMEGIRQGTKIDDELFKTEKIVWGTKYPGFEKTYDLFPLRLRLMRQHMEEKNAGT